MTLSTVEQFRRHVRGAAGIYGRIDREQLTGRNGDATAAGLDYHVAEAKRLLAADVADPKGPICDYLDTPRGRRLAEAWNRVERRHVGLPV